jgi:O-antigen/teichoic acid export membrane protein
MRLTVMVLPLAGRVAGSSAEIVGWIYGPQFLDAAPLLARLIYGAVALMMISTATAILTAAGKPNWTFTLTGPLIPVAVVGYLVLIPWLGPVGAATVTSVVATCGALLTAAAVHRVWQVHPPAATLVRSVLLCAAVYLLAALWPAAGLLLLVKLPVLALVVLLGFLLLGEFNPSEIGLVRSMVRQRLTLRPSAPGAS